MGTPDSSLQAQPAIADDRMPASGSDQYEVEELRRHRMQAILASRKHAIAAADAGYGSLRDVSSTQAQVWP